MPNILQEFLDEMAEEDFKFLDDDEQEQVEEEGIYTESGELILLEKAKTKTIKLSKMSQINRAAGAAALQIAKEKKDPLYTKYKKERKKALLTKAKIQSKYAARGRKKAKKSLM